MTFLLLAQAGIPLTSGFVAKFNVFAASVEVREYGLTFVGVLTTVIAAFFYLRLIVVMYMANPPEGEVDGDEPGGRRVFEVDPATGLALGLAVVATVVMGVVPTYFLDFAERATLLF
jgi:NADH-quinone oxidoreductase subunit N